ncbi:hypothetical protein CR159_12505 [Pollutimonas subterranea]|uniref:Uncharacterized protein n=1 Tax=Pollutimonas subterranea TaxID=2045210 RepID=A0A2N4U354_9BURK|nr:hypothetical protein CR159_12505 [Pollutimonas subterranea]
MSQLWCGVEVADLFNGGLILSGRQFHLILIRLRYVSRIRLGNVWIRRFVNVVGHDEAPIQLPVVIISSNCYSQRYSGGAFKTTLRMAPITMGADPGP